MTTRKLPRISIPESWPSHVKSAILHIISLAHFSITHARGWAANSVSKRVRTTAEDDRLHQEIALLREELRIKDVRMCAIAALRRPRYAPTERLAILEVRAARGWTLKQTADAFLVSSATVASWSKRVSEQGPKALLPLREPVNRFPDFVRYGRAAIEDPLSHDGQGQDRADTGTCRLAPQRDHGGTYTEGTASSRSKASSCFHLPRG